MIENNLKKLLREKKISVNMLSKETGLSRPTLTSLMNNDSKGIQFETLEKIIDYFDISISDFFSVYSEEVTFSFYSLIPISQIKEIEQLPPVKKKDNFRYYSPSEVITYSCQIEQDGKKGEPFNSAISPVISNNLIVAISLTFYRTNKNGKTKSASDIKSFIKKLDPDTMAFLVRSMLDNWYKRYKLVGDTDFSEMFIVNCSIVDDKPISYPVIVDCLKYPDKSVSFDLTGYKYSSLKNGNEDFSNSVIIKEIENSFSSEQT